MISALLLDMSAWTRLWDEAIPDSRAIEIAEDFEMERLAVSLPFLLEAGFSARNADEHSHLSKELAHLPAFPVNAPVERRVFAAQRQLADLGHHRLSPSDLLIAAVADRHELGVLHYDSDFDVILAKTDLEFHSEWLMPRGSL